MILSMLTMNDFTKDDKNNVHLIFDAQKESINFSWDHYLKYPEMKKYLVNEVTENGYQLRDARTNNIVMSASFSLQEFLL